MAAARHNLSRRALLGAGAAACALPAAARGHVLVRVPIPEPPLAPRAADESSWGHVPVHVPPRLSWNHALAAYRRAEARVAAFKAEAARLPAERRAFPCDDLEEAFARLDGRRLAALRRLLRLPAPDLTALALKLDLAIADLAWELDGCEACLATLSADARRLAYGG